MTDKKNKLNAAVCICPVRLADKSWLKVLLADLLWEKNIVRWLKSTAYKPSEHGEYDQRVGDERREVQPTGRRWSECLSGNECQTVRPTGRWWNPWAERSDQLVGGEVQVPGGATTQTMILLYFLTDPVPEL